MNDERLFRETMASLGVTPLDGPAPKPRKKERPTSQKERAEKERRKRAARQIRAAEAGKPARRDTEDELFLRAMGSLASGAGTRQSSPRQAPGKNVIQTSETPESASAQAHPPPRSVPRRSDREDALFLESMRRLDHLPDKDRTRDTVRPPQEPRVERLKPSKAPLEPDATLDLHGFKVEGGIEKLAHFIVAASQSGKKNVLVVTGKGLRSAGGRGVLKEAVERWLQREGPRFVRAYSEAARAQGGRGAFVVLLR